MNEATEIGADLLPAIDNVKTFERYYDVITDNFPFLNDSTIVTVGEDQALGVVQDPVFGTTTATSYVAFSAPSYPSYPFKNKNIDSVLIDSVVLTLKYTRSFGDSNSVQSFQAFEIDQSAGFDSNYFRISHADFAATNALSNPVSFMVRNLDDSLVLAHGTDTVRTNNQIRIPLDNNLFTRFQAYDSTNGGAFSSDSAFWKSFAGIAILPVSGDKRGLVYFDLTSAETGINFYCRIKQNGVIDTTTVQFPANAKPVFTNTGATAYIGRSANLIHRDISGTPFEANLGTAPASGANKELIYLQTTPGSFATVDIPYLDTIPPSVINLAELQIHAVPSADDNIYRKPIFMFLDILDSARGVVRTIPGDFALDQSTQLPVSTFGGTFSGDYSYFRLTRYVQGIVTGNDTLRTMRLYAPYATTPLISLPNAEPIRMSAYYGISSLPLNYPIAAGRVVLAGGANADAQKKMRLRVVYSKL